MNTKKKKKKLIINFRHFLIVINKNLSKLDLNKTNFMIFLQNQKLNLNNIQILQKVHLKEKSNFKPQKPNLIELNFPHMKNITDVLQKEKTNYNV